MDMIEELDPIDYDGHFASTLSHDLYHHIPHLLPPPPTVSAFRLFASVLASGIINPRTEFILSFVQEVLYCGETISTNVLQFMPVTMATHLLNTLSGVFMQDLALAIGQLEGPTPRKMAAKALCQTRR
nr:mediator of RNA polymerase II transcription subunit 24-like [Lytechinus pictus]